MKLTSSIVLLLAGVSTAQFNNATSDAEIMKAVGTYLDSYDGDMSVQENRLEHNFLSMVAQKFDLVGHLPQDLKDGIVAMISENDRVMSTHCQDGNCQVPFSLQAIWQYGCWCNFGASLMEGRGQPANTFDSICRDFQLCLRCARFDGKNEGYECDPVTQEYNMQGGPDFNSRCSGADNNLCATHVCTCEQTLLAELLEIVFEFPRVTEYEPEFLHANGYDPSGDCPAIDRPDSDMDCCGLYPKRFPYGPSNPMKDCCEDQTIFNPFTHDCCNNGVGGVAETGAC